MDQKNNQSLQESILAAYGAASFLPGAVAEVASPGPGPEKEKETQAREAAAGEMPYVEKGQLAGRIAHLDGQAQADIVEMSRIMGGHPIVAYVSADERAAGVLCSREWMQENWEIYCRFAGCFFRSHEAICTEFGAELRRVGVSYGK